MQARSRDTDPAAEEVQVALLRHAGVARRLGLALSLTDTVLGLARRGLRHEVGDASAHEAALSFVDVHYGRALGDALRRDLARRNR